MYDSRRDAEGSQEPAGGYSLDHGFLKSPKGTLLAAELVLSIIVFICYAASISSYLVAPLLEFFITSAFYFLYATNYQERFPSFNWPCVDFLRCASAVVVMLVVSIAAAARSGGEGGAVAGALFGFVLVAAFSYDGYVIFRTELEQEDPNARGGSSDNRT